MKRILITGANSYIGSSFETYIKNNYFNNYEVETIDLIDGSWRNTNFINYDVVYHVAGIAHSDSGKISIDKEKLYRSINTDLAVEVAKKAKSDGVKQFIFMSSSIVYGNSAPIGIKKVITKDTPVSPSNCYGDSKVQAENRILPLSDKFFKVVVLRPPMIYGNGCKGNFQKIKKIAMKFPLFPKVDNLRSMIYIENFVEFVRLMIENEEQGIFWPQNAEYINTSELVKLIAYSNGKKIRLISGLSWLLKIISHFSVKVNKAFGNFCYQQKISEYKENYRICSFEESIDSGK